MPKQGMHSLFWHYKKECEFEDELAEFFRSDPKIIPPATVSLLPTASAVFNPQMKMRN